MSCQFVHYFYVVYYTYEIYLTGNWWLYTLIDHQLIFRRHPTIKHSPSVYHIWYTEGDFHGYVIGSTLMEVPRYVLLEKAVGETPLQCMEAWRSSQSISTDTPLTYAGRLDPMASGSLLVLVGDECKQKDEYLALDKTYEFSVLFGIGSDTHDVLGRLELDSTFKLHSPDAARSALFERSDQLKEQLDKICAHLTGEIELPYPHFSSKTVAGKPLFQWSLENRLDEIEIPTRKSTIHSLTLNKIETKSRKDVCTEARANIDTIPEVTDERKQLGADFRRSDVRADWEHIKSNASLPNEYDIAHFTCHASSGTYMRTLARLIGEQLQPPLPSLAWSIHRTAIGDIT